MNRSLMLLALSFVVAEVCAADDVFLHARFAEWDNAASAGCDTSVS